MTNAGTASGGTQEGFKGAVLVDTDKVRAHVDEVVRSTVEETLNAMLDAEAHRVARAGKYERSANRQDTRADGLEHYGPRRDRRAAGAVHPAGHTRAGRPVAERCGRIIQRQAAG